MKYLEGLNTEQKKAVMEIHGPLLIIAGAGAGKTKTITHRISHIIASGVSPQNILAITFTNKAAKEMKERVKKILENERLDSMPWIGTFHSFGVKIIRENSNKFGHTQKFNILDESDAVSMIRDILELNNYDTKQNDPKRIKGIISRAKNKMMSPVELLDKSTSYVEQIAGTIWQKYEDQCKKENTFDFDDLLIEPVKLLKKDESVRTRYQNEFKYIHIDEYQDTNEVQYELSKILAGEEKNICVVGDGDQNIYSWRGANLRNMLNFEKDYPGARVVLLEENYRSTNNILTVANDIIQKNTVRKEKNLFTKKDGGEKIKTYSGYDEKDEASFIASQCRTHIEKGQDPEEICVLYRNNFQSRALEEAFIHASVPYQVLGTKFFDRKEIKDVLSYIRASRNNESWQDIKRVINFPSRKIGKTTIATIFAGQKSSLPANTLAKIDKFYELLDKINQSSKILSASELIRFIIKTTGIEDTLINGSDEDKERLENIYELVTVAKNYDQFGEDGLDRLIDDASLQGEQDTIDESQKSVRLMTIHGSKGLEFDIVFITGLEQDLLPHAKMSTAMSKEDSEEERRLMYVAVTRAKKLLYLTNAEIRTIYGNKKIAVPSEFLWDIDDGLVERIDKSHSRFGTIGDNDFEGKTIYLD